MESVSFTEKKQTHKLSVQPNTLLSDPQKYLHWIDGLGKKENKKYCIVTQDTGVSALEYY